MLAVCLSQGGADDARAHREELRKIREEQALLVSGPGRTVVSKITAGLLKKVSEHQSGRILKFTDLIVPKDLEKLIEVSNKARAQTWRLGGRGREEGGS